jgi:hypothetical protein
MVVRRGADRALRVGHQRLEQHPRELRPSELEHRASRERVDVHSRDVRVDVDPSLQQREKARKLLPRDAAIFDIRPIAHQRDAARALAHE